MSLAGGGPADKPILRSILSCPHCGRTEELEMPTEACQFFVECGGCGRLLRPREGDCCVFCSYGSVPCPPVQATRHPSRGAQ